MGKFDFEFPQSIMSKFERLADFDNIAPIILSAAIKPLHKNVKAECLNHIRTKNMYNSIKEKAPYKNKYGWYVCSRPSGLDKNGVRNMEKMAHAEYGTSKQPPTPILTKAIQKSHVEVEEILQDKYNLYIEKEAFK